MLLLVFAFVSGLVTILAPCIWPLLPIVLSSSSTGGTRKPLGITLGIIGSFSLCTLTLSYVVQSVNLNPDIPRLFAVVVIGFLGLSMVIPALSCKVEALLSRLSSYGRHTMQPTSSGLLGGLMTGVSLGIVWSPCAGPILATIAALAVTREVSVDVVLVNPSVCHRGRYSSLSVFLCGGMDFYKEPSSLTLHGSHPAGIWDSDDPDGHGDVYPL